MKNNYMWWFNGPQSSKLGGQWLLSFHLYYGKLPDVKVYTLAHLQLDLWVNKAFVPMLYSSNELVTLLFK